MNTHNFETAEARERRVMTQLFNQLGIDDYQYDFTPSNTKIRHDYTLTSTTRSNVMFLSEIKVRDTKSTDWGGTTFIEESKVQYLLDSTRGTDYIPTIVFFFKDGYAYKETLSHDKIYEVREQLCKKTTFGDQTKIQKRMIDFNIDRTKLIRLEFNIE